MLKISMLDGKKCSFITIIFAIKKQTSTANKAVLSSLKKLHLVIRAVLCTDKKLENWVAQAFVLSTLSSEFQL